MRIENGEWACGGRETGNGRRETGDGRAGGHIGPPLRSCRKCHADPEERAGAEPRPYTFTKSASGGPM